MSFSWPRRSRPLALNVLCAVAALAVVGTLVAALVFMANGGRWFVIATPSMGTTAPVGTLVLTQPTTVAQLHSGDIVSFHPPTAPQETYTHRIVGITASGAITTKGDINGAPDGWTLHQADLAGKASWIAPGLGWLVRALPILVLGIILVFLITRLVGSLQWRAALRIVGSTLVVSVAALILRPFTGIMVLMTTTEGHTAHARLVSTGLLPVQVQASHGTHVALDRAGDVGTVSIHGLVDHRYYDLTSALNLDFWGWVLFFLVCCIPFFVILIVGLPPRDLSELDDRRVVAHHDPEAIAARRRAQEVFA